MPSSLDSEAGTRTRGHVVRVAIVQPLLPAYRVPVFARLGRAPGIDLEICADLGPQTGSLQSVAGGSGFRTSSAPVRTLGPFLWQPGQVAAARSGRFDVIIYGWNSRYLHLGRALRTARRRGVRTILWGHGYSKDESPVRRRIRNRLLRSADACLLYNHSAAERLVAEGVERERVFVAPNAIDQVPIRAAREHWLARPRELAAFLASRGLTPGELVVFMSRLEPDKRVDLLLQAFAMIARHRPAARLAIIGTGADLPRLQGLIASLGIAGCVILAGPLYDDMQIAPWCVAASCFAYPVAIGLSILHAFGYGLPVVTSDDIASHNPEIEALRDGENGLLYPDGDIAGFAARIEQCLTDRALQSRLSQGALETVTGAAGFTMERMVEGMAAAIRFVMRESTGTASRRGGSDSARSAAE
jgi:glycosyltransferase involved in cell wall biosynthesis